MKHLNADSRYELFKKFANQSGNLFDSKKAALILETSTTETASLLFRWCKQGLISRVSQGVYALIPIDTLKDEFAIEDPWLLIPNLFEPAYVGGASALSHWDLTEQIFNTLFVFTPEKIRKKQIEMGSQRFSFKHIQEDKLFGLTSVWHGNSKILVSDIHRTFIDIFDDLETGGGVQQACESFKQYLSHKSADTKKLFEYATKFNSGAVFKRIGFLLTYFIGKNSPEAQLFQTQISKGYSYLDPQQKENVKLITEWHLFVPQEIESLLK